MKSANIFGKRHALKRMALIAAVFLTLLAGSFPVNGACPDIADIPLDTMEQKAPGMIMFVVDDSGSMDWSIMCPPGQESGGVFNGNYYIFKDPGDDAYGSRDNLEDIVSERMMWMSQWAGYNGMYYDPETEYTPWPTQPDADIDNPRSNPMNSTYTLDMTALWHELGVVDNGEAAPRFATTGTWTSNSTTPPQYGSNYLYASGVVQDRTATWTDDSLDSAMGYDVYARWTGDGTDRLTDVRYRTYNGSVDPAFPDTNKVAETGVNQQQNHGIWMSIATNVTFPSGTGIVQINENTGASGVCADAVRFVPANSTGEIMRRHYYVRTGTGTYLVNLLGGVIEYYRVNLDAPADNRETVTVGKLVRLTDTEAATAGIVTGRTYTEECRNFSNWYSFYRRRELTAKNAIGKVINTMDGVYIGLIFINNYRSQDTAVKPVRVNLEGTFVDESAILLDILYNYDISSYGTPLRNGLKKAGRYFQGDYLKPSTLSSHTNTYSYPFFKEDEGGSCQMAFTVIFSDGYYNGGSPGVSNADGDDNTIFDGSPFGDGIDNTLADVAMRYYESDLNGTLPDNVATSTVDTADHQHMVTYTLAFGVTGSLDTELYKDCPLGACPGSWPPTSSDSGKIDDMFHAAINGRGEYMSASSSAELNAALEKLKEGIEKRLGSAAGLASTSIQRTVGTMIFQGTYNTSNWFGEISALPLDAQTGDVGGARWKASEHVPPWNARNIFSYNGSGTVFGVGLTTGQRSDLEDGGLGTAEQIVDFIRGDAANYVSNGGLLRNRTHPIGDIVHSAPTFYNGTVYIGANDGMLHAVNAENGEELFTYVPGLVYDHLAELADPGYTHKYYVDGTPRVVDAGGQHLLVCGLRKGGKGYFALDVTNPAAMTAGNVLWEFSDPDDMGYAFSRPIIVKTTSDGYVVIVGNGYDSTNGEAILYVLNAVDGSVLRKIKTGAVGCNGLSAPAVVDMDFNGYPDYAFAGDLKGNMWKFDLRGPVADWEVYYQSGITPVPMVTLANEYGAVQPITASPEVMLDCAVLREGRGLMVLFGTGQYLNIADFADTTVQSLYGVWDWGRIWEITDDKATARSKYLGSLNSDRSLSNLGCQIKLMEQVVEDETSEWWMLSDLKADWYAPWAGTDANEHHMGWVFDLPESGERSLQKPLLRSGTVVMISTVPSNSPCDAGGRSTMWALDACSGGSINEPFFDSDDDGDIDEDDIINLVPPTGKKVTIPIWDILQIDDSLFYSDPEPEDPDEPPVDREDVRTDPIGMFFWRVLEQ